MEPTEYIWMSGDFVRWEDAKVHVLTHALHYGSGAFEGIRAYRTADGTAIFRLREHIERLFFSGETIAMKIPFSLEQITSACQEVLVRNSLEQGYIRPLIFYGYGSMGVAPKTAPVELAIACWPWGAYLPYDMVDLKISKYFRIHPGTTVTEAKLCGHYINSLLTVLEVEKTDFHEALLLDTDGNIAEGPGENFFIAKDGKLFTPKLGKILPGITRATIIEMVRDLGLEIEEKLISVEEALAADEAFYTGTAAEVTPIRSIDEQLIGDGQIGPLTERISGTYLDAVYGRSEKYKKYLTYVEGL